MPACSLCGFAFADERLTNADVSPYAQAYSCSRAGWRAMSEWVWFAGAQRLKHLALMRSSAASRRFARMNGLLLLFAVAVLQLARPRAWYWATAHAHLEPGGSLLPAGEGWLRVASRARPLPADLPAEISVDLWWSAPLAAINVVAGVVSAALLFWLLITLWGKGMSWAHPPPYKAERRMAAAVHYSTAWIMPLVVAACVAGLLPLSYIGSINQWGWAPPVDAFLLSAAVVAGVGTCLWWFWFVRMAATAPAKARGRVLWFATLGLPLLAAGCSATWWYGTHYLVLALTQAFRLHF